ncbi:hypothetical protein [Chryseobacterium indoltheticum]|uniref:hypothetical protein n=1 Tax=Chryseobacterium indoltheticum TaxID=254 RepID=UPI003F4928A6
MNFINHKIKVLAFAALSSGIFLACAQTKTTVASKPTKETSQSGKVVPTNLKWSERMMLSEMQRFPEAWMLSISVKARNGRILQQSFWTVQKNCIKKQVNKNITITSATLERN